MGEVVDTEDLALVEGLQVGDVDLPRLQDNAVSAQGEEMRVRT